MTKNKNKRPSATEALKLIPEKIKDKLNGKTKDKDKEKGKNNSSYENKKLIDEESLSNKNINESKNDSNNNNDIKIFTTNKFVSINKIQKNIDDINKNINKGLVSGQTFYQFFKNNPDSTSDNPTSKYAS